MTDLWNKYKRPPESALKNFKRRGGFRGTAINPMWMIQMATQEWGPLGGNWGFEIANEAFVDRGEFKFHILAIKFRHPGGEFPVYGGTEITDDEFAKKSLTDAVTKALSWLGFGSDVHRGKFDGSKYIDDEFDECDDEPDESEEPEPRSEYARTKDDVAEESTPKKRVDEVARGKDWLDIPESWPGPAREAFKSLFTRCIEYFGPRTFEENMRRHLTYAYNADRLDEVRMEKYDNEDKQPARRLLDSVENMLNNAIAKEREESNG